MCIYDSAARRNTPRSLDRDHKVNEDHPNTDEEAKDLDHSHHAHSDECIPNRAPPQTAGGGRNDRELRAKGHPGFSLARAVEYLKHLGSLLDSCGMLRGHACRGDRARSVLKA